jgi:hypothetical protein
MIISEPIYDGSLIHSRFAYKYFRKNVSPIGDIVAFVAPMFVTTNLIDLEDSLEKDYIMSDKAINFCWEIPNLDPFGAVAFQRLFNTNIANILYKHINKPIMVKGDDIMVTEDESGAKIGKASVSITYSKEGVAVGHTGINITAGSKAPNFAYSTNMDDDTSNKFIQDVINVFYDITKDIFVATTKVIV